MNTIFEDILDEYHKKTFDAQWVLDCGDGDKKLDEIRIFVTFLKNNGAEIKSVTDFVNDFQYKEGEIEEPGDLKYHGQTYQISRGNDSVYGEIQRRKENGLAFMLPAKDVVKIESFLEVISPTLDKKELSSNKKVVLLLRLDRRRFKDLAYELVLKRETNWQDIILVFDDKNFSITDSKQKNQVLI